MKLTGFLLLVSVIILSYRCNKKNDNADCISYPVANAIEATGPATGNINESLSFLIKFPLVNGCGSFSRFEDSTAGNTIFIKAIAKYEGCICTAIYGEQTKEYIFKKSFPGNYQLKFNKGNGDYIVKDIVIQ